MYRRKFADVKHRHADESAELYILW